MVPVVLKQLFFYVNSKPLDIKLLVLFSIAIILVLFLFILRDIELKKNKKSEKYINEVLSELRNLAHLWKRGLLSWEKFEDRRKTILADQVKINKIFGKNYNSEFIKKYSESLDITDEGIIITKEGAITHISKKLLEVLGYSKKDLDFKILFDSMHPDDLDFFIKSCKNINEDTSPHTNKPHRVVTFDGHVRWFELNSIYVSKEKKAIISFFKDVTRVAQAELDLMEALDSYYTIFEHSPISFWEIDISDLKAYISGLGNFEKNMDEEFFDNSQKILFQCINSIKILNLNKANLNLFDISNKSVLIENSFKLINNDFRDIFIKLFKAVSAGGFSDESEIDFRSFAGREKHATAKFLIVKSNGEMNSKALLFINDVTEQKNLIKKIQNLSQFHESIINDASIWLSVFDNDLNTVVWNKAAEQISGYSKEEILARNDIWSLLYPDKTENENIKNKIISFNNNGSINEFETTIRCKNGQNKIILWNIKKFKDSENNKIGFINIGYDYTDKKNMEEKLTHIAMHDSLTGLYNRTIFEEHLDIMFKERGLKVCLIVLDIDGLKYVNDTLGHQQGDRLIISAARILNNTFRPSDIICRIGGDEFAVLLRNVDEEQIQAILSRLKNKVEEYNHNLKINKFPLNISFGYSIKEDGVKTALQSFKEADDMLFEKKVPKKESVINSVLGVIRATMLEKDAITEEHMMRLKTLATNFAEAMDFDEADKEKLVISTELHDIGKVVIPDEILSKDSTLNEGEFEVIKKHSKSGYRIASLTPTIKNISKYILYSHERWDGQGYPEGLKGEEIPIISRMVHIIDAYDVMVNTRPYKKEMPVEMAITELKKHSGKQFDPNLVKVFLNDVLKIEMPDMIDLCS